MDQQESRFLAGALSAGDPLLEQQLLAGYHLVRAGCRIADDDPVDLAAMVLASREARRGSDFAANDPELVGLLEVEGALLAAPLNRAALHAAFAHYAHALSRNVMIACAMATFELAERLWCRECDHASRLDATFRYSLTAGRMAGTVAEYGELPLILAMRARAARSRYYLGLARYLRVERAALSGNLPHALGMAQHLVEWARRWNEPGVEQWSYLALAMIHGRMGNPLEAVRCASRSLEIAGPGGHAESAHTMIGNGLIDLGLLDEARESFELLLLSPGRSGRHGAMIGLMDVAIRRDDEASFRDIRRRLDGQHLYPGRRLIYLRDAAVGLARFGDADAARPLLEEARALARSLGYGLDYIQADLEMDRLALVTPAVRGDSMERALRPELSSLHARHGRSAVALTVALS